MVTEKITAAAKQVASILSGKAGILNTLEREHAEVSARPLAGLADLDDLGDAERRQEEGIAEDEEAEVASRGA